MITKVIKLDINKNLYEKIKAKQGDTKSRFLLFQLLDGSMPFNLENRSVRAYMLKPDSTEVFNDLIINNRNTGHCTLELTNQVLAVAGIVKIELMIIENDKKITSSIFELQVDKSINSENSIVSTNEFNALLNGLASLSEYDNYKEKAKKVPELEENIQELGSQLDKNKNDILKIKDYTLKNAKFKPNFKHNLYWCEKTELDWENDLLVFKKCGIKKAVLVVMIEKDSDNTFRLENKFEKYIKFLNDNHVKYDITHVDIKIHFNFSNQIVIDFGRFDFIPIYEKLVEQIVRYVHDNISNLIKVENVTYLNETWFYNRTWKLEENWVEDKYTQSKYHAFWDNLKTIVNKYGYKNSVCFAGVKGYITASSYLLNTLDFIGINTYPSLSQSFEKTTIEQCIESWKCHDIYNQIKEIRNSFPNKPIFITETGCQDWWASLIRTESYNMDIKYRVPSHGITTYLMMKSFFEVFNDLIDEVWWWFEVKQSNYDKNIAMIKEYVGGEY